MLAFQPNTDAVITKYMAALQHYRGVVYVMANGTDILTGIQLFLSRFPIVILKEEEEEEKNEKGYQLKLIQRRWGRKEARVYRHPMDFT